MARSRRGCRWAVGLEHERDMWERLHDIVIKRIWAADTSLIARPRRFIIESLRFAYLIAGDLLKGQLSLRAMSLVYTTMLSLVPLLAVTFSVLKGFGVHNQLEPLLSNVLAPLGPKGTEVTATIIGFVDNIQVGVLGSVGLALLVYFVISLVYKVESTLNFIWRIKKPRRLVQRFSEYLSVILVGPVLMFAALGITASISSTTIFQDLLAFKPIGAVALFVSRLVPYLLVSAAFTFIYIFIPHTRVRFSSALAGGVVAGILWQTVGWVFASFVASSGKYAAIYSGFAVLAVFMIWIYVSWYILLIGAQVSYYVQNPQLLRAEVKEHQLNGALRERLGLMVMFLIAYNHYYNKPPWTDESLASYLGVSVEAVQVALDGLSDTGFVLQVQAEPTAYVPARDIETVTLKALRDGMREAGSTHQRAASMLCSVPAVNDVLKRIDVAVADALADQTIKTLVREHGKVLHTASSLSADTAASKRQTA